MPITSDDQTTLASAAYAALRYQGAPPAGASAALGLAKATAFRLERLFQARPGGGADPMRPRFARHAAHVRAVLGQGGYPTLPERRR